LKNFSSRNFLGKKLIRFRAGVGKHKNYFIDLKRSWNKQFFILLSFFKNFKDKIFGFIKYANGSCSYINLIHGMRVGFFYKSTNVPAYYIKNIQPGYGFFIKYLTRFSFFCNLILNSRSKYATAPGTYCKINKHLSELSLVEIWLPSGEKKIIFNNSLVFLGRNANINQKNVILGKAGFLKRLGFRPNVRGVAMNPVDHPNGGRTKTNSPSKSAWGWISKKSK